MSDFMFNETLQRITLPVEPCVCVLGLYANKFDIGEMERT